MKTAIPVFRRQLTADGSDTLYSVRYGQTFHSTHGALAESEHVFLQAAGVQPRLAAGKATTILEVGFGTGLNFWLTACRALSAGAPLRYVALEQQLLPAGLLAELNHGALLPEIAEPRRSFLAWRATLPADVSASPLIWPWRNQIRLELVVGEATTAAIPPYSYHAIYHDAFSPTVNPELWTVEFFQNLHQLLKPGGKLTTYSVKGTVRRALQAVGFGVQKQPGPPGKREILVAIKE